MTTSSVPAASSPGSSPTAATTSANVVELARRVTAECARVLVGLEEPLRDALYALLAGGHVLLEGPPGVAKTLLVRTLATALGGSFARLSFTPDLMPSDVTGTSVFHPRE